MDQSVEHPYPETGDARRRRAAHELTRQLARAQDAIRRRSFGVIAEVVLRSGFDEEGEGEWQQLLCFGVLEGRWRLYLKSGYLERPESICQSDLFTSDLETRLIAARKVPVLVHALETVEMAPGEHVSLVARARANHRSPPFDRLSTLEWQRHR